MKKFTGGYVKGDSCKNKGRPGESGKRKWGTFSVMEQRDKKKRTFGKRGSDVQSKLQRQRQTMATFVARKKFLKWEEG